MARKGFLDGTMTIWMASAKKTMFKSETLHHRPWL
jgi:hypothetical protein